MQTHYTHNKMSKTQKNTHNKNVKTQQTCKSTKPKNAKKNSQEYLETQDLKKQKTSSLT